MKTILVTLSILVYSCGSFSQEYRKLVDTTNKWNYLDSIFLTSGIGEAKTNSLFITNDTIIEEVFYKKLMCKIIREIDTSVVFAAGIREDTVNQQVFLKEPFNSEKLLYSFNHSVGDTISIDTAYWDDYYTIRYVKSIGTYDFNGFTGKKIEICDSLYSINNPNMPPSELTTDFWYEGIGSLISAFNLYEIGNIPVGYVELLCFWNQNSLIYQSPRWTVCEYAVITAIKDNLIKPELKIYPNPTTGRLNIFSPAKIKEIIIKNIDGKVVFLTHQEEVDISNMANGVYFLQIMTESNEIIFRKLIKNAL